MVKAIKLNINGIERMMDMFAMSPLEYKPVDKRLIESGLLQIYDDMNGVYEPSFLSDEFYDQSGSVKAEWIN